MVEVERAGATVWDPASVGQLLYPGDQVRTGERSRAAVRLSNRVLMRVAEMSQLQVPSPRPGKPVGLRLLKGVFYFFHRERPDDFELSTPTVSAVIRGTEFQITVGEDGSTTLSLLDGQVALSNALGQVTLTRGMQGSAAPGRPPVVRAMLQGETSAAIQWCLYYPGILNLEELALSSDTQQALAASLAAYREGDLKKAVATYPATRVAASFSEEVYRAALGLAVGQIDGVAAVARKARDRAAASGPSDPTEGLASNLEQVVAAVKFETNPEFAGQPPAPTSATAWLAESYRQQSLFKLDESLAAARKASELAPSFGFAWARLAELELSFGRTRAAERAVERSLQLSPRNAQAMALHGFLLAGKNRPAEALAQFDRAVAADGALANGWLGRGLCLIRLGRRESGLEAIQTAATVEPQRALLRSYLGKAFAHAHANALADRDLALAMEIDPRDPTPWLYSALIRQEENRINEAVDDLEKSLELVGNRRIVRSSLLLDQDRAVAAANLATLYRDAGMTEVALREAAGAINADYTSFRAHLFLADSYAAALDPQRISLRFETAAVDEYLVANLLAPVGAGVLSPFVTQQEYARLFEVDRVGFAASAEYWSRGDWFQTVAHHGTLANSSYLIEGSHRSLNGDAPNADLELWAGSVQFKQQLAPQDSVFLQVVATDGSSGDTIPHYNPAMADRNLRVRESQAPLALLGYHHEWSPASHTLLLGGFFQDTLRVNDPDAPQLMLLKDGSGNVVGVPLAYRPQSTSAPPVSALGYQSDFNGATAELQQLVQTGPHTLVGGARFQFGRFDTTSRLGASTPTLFANGSATSYTPLGSAPVSRDPVTDFQRWSLYAYDSWRWADGWLLTAGLSYDNLRYPRNFRSAPVSDGELSKAQWSPKAGLAWAPTPWTTLRAAYSRALGGVGFDQSFQLEPTQVAGFNQAWRSLIPEAVAGAIAGAPFETWGVTLDQRFGSRTYVGVTAEVLGSEVNRYLGTLDVTFAFPPALSVSTTREHLDYSERTLLVTVNQLVGRHWSLGASYRLSHAGLQRSLTQIPSSVTTSGNSDEEGLLHRLNLFTRFNHESGFFGQLDSIWTGQSNEGYSPNLAGDHFWHFNVAGGYRFFRRAAELRIALLNLTGQDYRLNPLNIGSALPRDRTLVTSLQLAF